jgi:hypothetical protein
LGIGPNPQSPIPNPQNLKKDKIDYKSKINLIINFRFILLIKVYNIIIYDKDRIII